jgi:hypothetical protein
MNSKKISVQIGGIVILLFISCGNQIGKNKTMDQDKLAFKKIKYFKDFDIYNFSTSKEEYDSPPNYPYVEYEEIPQKKEVRIKFCWDDKKNYEEYFEKKQDFFFKKAIYEGDGVFSENVFLYVKDGVRYQYIYYQDSISHKNSPQEFFLNEFSVETNQMRRTIILNNPENEFQPKELFKHGPNEIKVSRDLIYSETIETYSINKEILSVTSKTSFSNGNKKEGKKCYDLLGTSLNWFHYFGLGFRQDC